MVHAIYLSIIALLGVFALFVPLMLNHRNKKDQEKMLSMAQLNTIQGENIRSLDSRIRSLTSENADLRLGNDFLKSAPAYIGPPTLVSVPNTGRDLPPNGRIEKPGSSK